MRLLVIEALQSAEPISQLEVYGWVRTRRDAKTFSFLEINDGSCLANLQIVANSDTPGYEHIHAMQTGAAVKVCGALVPSQGQGQRWELQAASLELIGAVAADYPLQKKGMSAEFLRSIAHLRPRTNLYGAVFRLRSRLSFAIHEFFNKRHFSYVHTPIITASDCEGAGEMFRVSTLESDKAHKDHAEDFFAKAAFLTVSGQLEGEAFACALGNIYTFGPTFRAENSNTSRHAAEFWMIEPEMAFCDLQGDMQLAEEFIKYLIGDIMQNCAEDLQIFAKFIDKTLLERLQNVLEQPFVRLSYCEAIQILEQSGQQFNYPVSWGLNMQSEHERYLTEQHFKSPVIVYNYPKDIKPFYMRSNADGRTVAAMDVLVPGIGEIIGGSQREERLEILLENMQKHQLNAENYWWYVDLRRYGSVPHAGFGMGFERMLMFITGMGNIRDVIPFARTPGNCEF